MMFQRNYSHQLQQAQVENINQYQAFPYQQTRPHQNQSQQRPYAQYKEHINLYKFLIILQHNADRLLIQEHTK